MPKLAHTLNVFAREVATAIAKHDADYKPEPPSPAPSPSSAQTSPQGEGGSGNLAHGSQHAERVIVLAQAHQLPIANLGNQYVILFVRQARVLEYR